MKTLTLVLTIAILGFLYMVASRVPEDVLSDALNGAAADVREGTVNLYDSTVNLVTGDEEAPATAPEVIE